MTAGQLDFTCKMTATLMHLPRKSCIFPCGRSKMLSGRSNERPFSLYRPFFQV